MEELLARIRLSIAAEEVAIEALSDQLARIADLFPDSEVTELRRLIRSHRVGLLKQRAVMGALGIDV